MSNDSIEELINSGFKLINAEDYEEALKVGEQLRAQCHTSAFEILALAHAGLDETERAVEVLEEGVEKGPTVWPLWQLLGNYRSDLGRYEEAHAAYEHALACPEVNRSSVHLNVAIALTRQDRLDEAMKQLERIDDDAIQPHAEAQRLRILNQQQRYDEVIARGESLLTSLEPQADNDVRAHVEIELGEAYWRGWDDAERALELAWSALAHDASPGALWLICTVEGRKSPTAQYYRILVEGDWPYDEDGDADSGFFITYDVIADSIDEAMTYVRRFEGEELAPSLQVSEYEALEPRPTDPKGVYHHTCRILFPKDSETDE